MIWPFCPCSTRKHSEAGCGRPVDRGAWTAKTVKRPPQQPAQPPIRLYWAPLVRKRHILPHPAQPQHTNHWAPRTRKRQRQQHRLQRSNRTQHAKGRTGDCQGPGKKPQPDGMSHRGLSMSCRAPPSEWPLPLCPERANMFSRSLLLVPHRRPVNDRRRSVCGVCTIGPRVWAALWVRQSETKRGLHAQWQYGHRQLGGRRAVEERLWTGGSGWVGPFLKKLDPPCPLRRPPFPTVTSQPPTVDGHPLDRQLLLLSRPPSLPPAPDSSCAPLHFVDAGAEEWLAGQPPDDEAPARGAGQTLAHDHAVPWAEAVLDDTRFAMAPAKGPEPLRVPCDGRSVPPVTYTQPAFVPQRRRSARRFTTAGGLGGGWQRPRGHKAGARGAPPPPRPRPPHPRR